MNYLHLNSSDAVDDCKWWEMIRQNGSDSDKLNGSVKETNIWIYFLFHPSLTPIFYKRSNKSTVNKLSLISMCVLVLFDARCETWRDNK